MENLEDQQIDYNALLDYYIPRLNQFECKKGNEGQVYFVSDDYVVKKMAVGKMSATYNFFDKYYEENQLCCKQGYNIPKIYAYKREKEKYFSDLYYHYILIERIKGEQLFLDSIYDSYDMCKHFCNQENFIKALNGKNNELELEITKKYISSILKNNLSLQELPDSEIEKFLDTIYTMYKENQCAFPDVHSENVIINNILMLIDPQITSPRRYLENEIASKVLNNVINLFSSNSSVIIRSERVNAYNIDNKEINRLKNLTLDISKQNLLRFVKYIKKAYHPIVYEKTSREYIEKSLKNKFIELPKEILNEIEMI